MKLKSMLVGLCVLVITPVLGCAGSPVEKCNWVMHDVNRPTPSVITVGEQPCQPPSDAIILFDGKNLSEWVSDKDGGPAKWKVENGYMEVVKKTGYIRTKRSFGSCQLHIEWMCPPGINKVGQKRSNSGVFLMTKYEVQILDSYKNTTYADGQAASIYGQNPPLVNTCRPPGQWQSFDMIFRRPVFKKGKLVKPATITLLHNGVLVQDHYVIKGTTRHKRQPRYEPHPDKLPIKLQDHGDPVRFRNIWIRELPDVE